MTNSISPNTGQSDLPLCLEMRHIAKSFGGVRALRDVSFTARRGRGPRHLRRERRGQEHAHEDPGRRDHRF